MKEFKNIDRFISSRENSFYLHSQQGAIKWSDDNIRVIDNKSDNLPPWWKNEFRFPDLSLLKFQNAFSYFKYPYSENGNRIWQGDCWDENHKIIEESLLNRQCQNLLDKNEYLNLRQTARKIKGDYFYLGWLTNHYGHFIMESLSRLWPLLYYKDYFKSFKFVFHNRNRLDEGQGISLSRFFQFEHIEHSLNQFGIDEQNLMEITEPVIFENLIIPVPSIRLGMHQYCTIQQIETWEKIPDLKQNPDRKIYLSRQRYLNHLKKKKRPLENENEIEEIFRDFGFGIIYPEKIPFSEQMKIYGNTKFAAGPVGSNMHNMVFMNDGSEIIMIAPRSFILKIDVMISILKKNTLYYFIEDFKNINSKSTFYWNVDEEKISKFLSKQ